MLFMFIWMIIILMLSMMIMKLSSILAMKTIYNQEKNSPFECGFDPISSARMPFSLHFFLISIIFLIFDIEIALLLPMIIIFFSSNSWFWLMTSMIFILILLFGLYYEWNSGMLKWT